MSSKYYIDKMIDEIRECHGKIQNREVDESLAVIVAVPLSAGQGGGGGPLPSIFFPFL